MGQPYRARLEAALGSIAGRARNAMDAKIAINLLVTFNQGSSLYLYVDRLGRLDQIPIPLLLTIARAFSVLNRQDLAFRYLDEAKRADPDYPPTLLARGQVLLYMGRFDEAKLDIERCLRRAPELAQGWWLQSQAGRQTADRNHVCEIRAQLGRKGLKFDELAMLQVALHKELDELGDYEAAWQALQRGCMAKRGTLQYTAAHSRELCDFLIAMPSMEAVKAASSEDKTPIFIVGMHRSGTTLLEQLLDGSPQVRGVGELYDVTSAMRHAADHHCKGVIDTTIVQRATDGVDFADVGRRYLDGMAWRLGDEAFFTDKLPSNFLNIGFICRALPQAKILHMVRDPVETGFSNLRELFSDANPYSYDQLELADYFLQYRRLMAHWHAAYPGRILDVDYAALTRDPEAVMRKVAAFCGIDYSDAMSDPRSSKRAVSTASAVQVRDRVVRREVPKWAPYASHLEPLMAALRHGGVEVQGLPA